MDGGGTVMSERVCSVLVPAAGLAFSQGWLPVVAALSSAYRDGGDVAFICAPLFFGYAAGLLVAAATRLFRPAPPHGVALGASLLGFMVLIVTHSMNQILWGEYAWPIGIAAFAACLFSGFGSTLLGLGWVEALHGGGPVEDSGRRTVAWTLAALTLALLVPVASALGHNVWVPLVNGMLVAVSAVVLMAGGGARVEADDRADASRTRHSAACQTTSGPAAGPHCAPAVVACAILGLVFATMIGQFLGARFGRALPYTWLFGVVGVLAVAAMQAAVRRARGSWDPTATCWLVAAAMVVAFYPIDAGSDFSLKFAMAGATCALWMLAAVLPCALDRYIAAFAPVAAESAAPSAATPYYAAALAGFVGGALVGGPLGLLIARTSFQGTFVLVSAIVSMVAGFVALVWLLHPRDQRAQTSEGATAPAADESDAAGAAADGVGKGSLEERCATLAAASGLTPRELDVLMVLARGYDTARVQEELGISEGTALTHKRHIYQKLDVHTRAELLDCVRKR